jgi:hypothetical protein
MYTLNEKTLRLDKAFTTEDGRQFPRNWLRLSTKADRDALGIVETPDVVEPYYDQRFYWGPQNPKDLDQLKEQWTSQVKQTAGSLLAQTDWYVIRQSENSAGVPAEVLSRRSEIRTFSNEKEAAIAAATTVEEFVAYVTGADFNRWEPLPPEPEPEPVVEETPVEASAEEVVVEEPVAEAPAEEPVVEETPTPAE